MKTNKENLEKGYSFCLNEWALDKDIKSELGLLLIISSLTAKQGYCSASNDYFSDVFNCDSVSISRKIKKLADKGYIIIEYQYKGNAVSDRKIRITKTPTFVNKNVNGAVNKNVNGAVNKNVKDNNIIYNNKNILSKDNIQKETLSKNFEEFWNIFPKQRKGSKDSAFKAYCNVVSKKGISVEYLLSKVKEYAKSDEVQRGFACGGAKWFNSEKYNNDFSATQGNQNNYGRSNNFHSQFTNEEGIKY